MPQDLDFIPPFRFAIVEDGVYRGAYPVLRNFPFLRSLGLRTILSLTPEDAVYDLKRFAESESITLKYLQAERHKGEPQLLPTDISEALQILLNADLHPVYIHCLDGRQVVGLVIMALRRVLYWDSRAIHAEYLRFASSSDGNELGFILDYPGGFTLPLNIPSWLWNGQWTDHDGRTKKHPNLKVRYPHVSQSLAMSTMSGTISTSSADVLDVTGSPANAPSPTVSQKFVDITASAQSPKPLPNSGDLEALGLRGRGAPEHKEDGASAKKSKRSLSV